MARLTNLGRSQVKMFPDQISFLIMTKIYILAYYLVGSMTLGNKIIKQIEESSSGGGCIKLNRSQKKES